MKAELKRREFVGKCFRVGLAGCAFVLGKSQLDKDPLEQLQKPDPKSLTYCGYKCTVDCSLYKATIENSPELKKKAYEEFKWKEKFKIDFDPDKVFCYGCKPKDKPISINVNSCTVRKCAIEKKYDCCIECNGLTACDKELWKNYPKFKEKILEMQKIFKST